MKRLPAAAKINLALLVGPAREDGLHELVTVMQRIDICDAVEVAPAQSLAVDGFRKDTIVRAALERLAAAAGVEPHWRAEIRKRIPLAAGLGGGSADAAAALVLANPLLEEPLPAERLAELASGIGADVPFFAAQLPAGYVTGIGDRLEALPQAQPLPQVVLAIPPFGLSTAAVFAELRRSDWTAPPPRSVEPGHNDLLAAARRLRPEIDDLMRLMRHAGAEPHLTGSGPTLFALTNDPERSEAIRERLTAEGVRTIATRLRGLPASIEAIEEEEQ